MSLQSLERTYRRNTLRRQRWAMLLAIVAILLAFFLTTQ